MEVLREVHVQHEAAAHLLQRPEARGIARLVELCDDIAQLWIYLQKLLERTERTSEGGREGGREKRGRRRGERGRERERESQWEGKYRVSIVFSHL